MALRWRRQERAAVAVTSPWGKEGDHELPKGETDTNAPDAPRVHRFGLEGPQAAGALSVGGER